MSPSKISRRELVLGTASTVRPVCYLFAVCLLRDALRCRQGSCSPTCNNPTLDRIEPTGCRTRDTPGV